VREALAPAAATTAARRRGGRRSSTDLDRRRADSAGLTPGVGRRARDWIPASSCSCSDRPLAGLTTAFDVETFLLPKPSDIARRFWTDKGVLWDYGVYTFKEALGGFALGSGLGILAALVPRPLPQPRRRVAPLRVAANAVPIIAFAPITNNWFGLLNPFSKMAIAAVLCFFPVMVNTLRGPDDGEPAVDRADALLRGRRRLDVPARPHPELAAVHVHRPEGGGRALDDRCHRGRVLRRPDESRSG
jgi:hypothetical protein